VLLFTIKKQPFMLTPSRVALEVADPKRIRYDSKYGHFEDWMREYAICYERMDRVRRADAKQAEIMLADICNMFGINAKWEQRKILCLVIHKSGGEGKDQQPTMRMGTTYKSAALLAFGLDMTQQYPPVVDESGYVGDIV